MNERVLIDGHPFVPYRPARLDADEMERRARTFADEMHRRRSVRHFSAEPIPMEVVREAVRAAGSAPSGANMQPWRFVVVTAPEIRRQIREGAEKEEYAAYHDRMPEAWLEALRPLQTDWRKEFLETAPVLIVVFKMDYRPGPDGEKVVHYYPNESVGIACGMLLTALHHAGLATLTHTPSPMGFLREILGRPRHEKPFLLIPVGYPADDALVPDIERKDLDEILVIR